MCKHLSLRQEAAILLVLSCLAPLPSLSQTNGVRVVRENKQCTFPDEVPAGNYSGITPIEGNEYAVVSDKSEEDGYFVFSIDIDSITGEIKSVQNKGFRSSNLPNRDGEGIAYMPCSKTILISGEGDGRILEYDLQGQRTTREVAVPDVYKQSRSNLGLESLTYSRALHQLWTCNESTLEQDGESADAVNGVANRIRLQCFDDSLRPVKQYAYLMDKPYRQGPEKLYAMGVSELTALDDSSLLVLEREFRVPHTSIGAHVYCKIYRVKPQDAYVVGTDSLTDDSPYLPKELLCQWDTRLSLLNHQIANYEGMCLGPKLTDGSQVLILVSDSQNQYVGVLKDWFKTIVIKMD